MKPHKKYLPPPATAGTKVHYAHCIEYGTPRRKAKRPEFTAREYQYIEALVVVGKFGHDRRTCAGCEICTSINALRARIGNCRLQPVMMAVADRLGLRHD